MIRFCDKEVCCVTEDEMDRQQMVTYFLDGHRMEMICVLDKEGKFSGSTTYSMILGRELCKAINRECIVLGDTTWEEARRCFERYPVEFGGMVMIPVIDEERNLLCFAYQDDEANRELRMLDELWDHKSALTFTDVYPEYDSVIVHGCNELAFQFVMYLKKCGVPVDVTGELWDYLLCGSRISECKGGGRKQHAGL